MDKLDADLRIVIAEMQAEIARRLEERTSALERRIAAIHSDGYAGAPAAVSVAVHADWREVPLMFHLPSATSKEQRLVLGLPETLLREQDLVFHAPALRTALKKVGQTPEFQGFGLRWRDLLARVPEVVMEAQHVRLALPEFTTREREILVRVPQVAMVENRVLLRLPQFSLRDGKEAPQELRAAADEARKETEAAVRADLKEIGQQAQERIVAAVAHGFDAARERLQEQRAQAMLLFDGLIASCRETLDELRRRGAGSETLAGVEERLHAAVADRAAAASVFDAQSAQLDHQEQQVVRDMLDRLAFRLPDAPAHEGPPLALPRRPLGALQLVSLASISLPS
ncbi:MAG TPA: hypothetical protein VF522_19385 [Ramlibacter sp.]|uniref:hypothetical protein n=1 Tax=Ramlibacter sp. TaxID=1917967 RepID=UPI002ED6BCFB